jgi:NhaP-type Na+/H+ or K+/H+ antiporter
VIGALKALQAPEKLGDIIKGESLLNDGSAFVLFKVCLEFASTSGDVLTTKESTIDFVMVLTTKFLKMALGGAGFGFLAGVVMDIIFQITHKPHIEMMILYTFVIGTFFWAEHLCHFSGVLAVVFLGFFTLAEGHYAQAENEHTFHVVLGFIAHSCNELIFLIAGVVTWRFGFESIIEEQLITPSDILESFVLYIGIHVVRAILLVLCFPIMKRIGYGLTVKEAMIMWYGGLRGAVGLAMVLEVAGTISIDPRARAKIAFHVSVIVLMTLVINGMTVSRFYKWLKVYKVVQHHTHLLQRSVEKCEEIASCHVRLLREHWLYSNCYFDIIRNLVPSLDGEGGEVVLENDGHGHEKIKTNMKNLKKGFEYMANMSVQRDHSDRLIQKLRYQKRWGAKSMRLVLPMLDDETEFKHTGKVPVHRGGKTGRAMTKRGTEIAHERQLLERHGSLKVSETTAKRRWHAAVTEIIASQRLVHAAQERAQRTREEAIELEKAQSQDIDRISKVLEVLEDTETMMQLYQTIINAVKAQLLKVFESNLIHEAPFRLERVVGCRVHVHLNWVAWGMF